jgi:hypothetical protein
MVHLSPKYLTVHKGRSGSNKEQQMYHITFFHKFIVNYITHLYTVILQNNSLINETLQVGKYLISKVVIPIRTQLLVYSILNLKSVGTGSFPKYGYIIGVCTAS